MVWEKQMCHNPVAKDEKQRQTRQFSGIQSVSNSADHARFLALFEQSGMRTKAHFITERIFGGSFKVIKIDKTAVDYYTRLTTFYAQFRAIGVNYNQIVKALNSNFTEKKALSFR